MTDRVRVYFNLHKHTFSIQRRSDKGWRVSDYADEVLLEDVSFKVSEAGRQRVLATGQKNVHAFVTGTLVSEVPPTTIGVRYNPHQSSKFITSDGGPVQHARFARLVNKQVQVADPSFHL